MKNKKKLQREINKFKKITRIPAFSYAKLLYAWKLLWKVFKIKVVIKGYLEHNLKELSLRHKLWFSNPYIYAT